MKTKFFVYFSIVLMIFLAGCAKEKVQKANSREVRLAKEILNGSIILSTKCKISNVDKTLLKNGCPAKYDFKWEDDKMRLVLENFSVGTMPFEITFMIYTKFMSLNSWEQDEYPEDGWVKFKGDNGSIAAMEDGKPKDLGEKDGGANIKGFLNLKTKEIEFIINFNVMNVIANCFQQTIDYSRINNFEEEKKQYEIDLKNYKDKEL